MSRTRRSSSKIQWNEITWYSRLIAIVIFFGVVPAVSFYIGTQYQETLNTVSQAGNFYWERQTFGNTVP